MPSPTPTPVLVVVPTPSPDTTDTPTGTDSGAGVIGNATVATVGSNVVLSTAPVLMVVPTQSSSTPATPAGAVVSPPAPTSTTQATDPPPSSNGPATSGVLVAYKPASLPNLLTATSGAASTTDAPEPTLPVLSDLLTASSGASSPSATPVQSLAVIPVPTVPSGTSTPGGTASSNPSTSSGGSDPNQTQTGVISVLDGGNNWQLYQLAISTNNGVASVTQTALAPGSGSEPPALPVVPRLANLSGPPSSPATGNGRTSFVNPDGSPAQHLPDTHHVTVVGVLNADNTWKMYWVPIDPTTGVLELHLASQAGVWPAAGELDVVDGTGRKLADAVAGPDARALSMTVPMDPVSRSAGVYVKVAASPDLSSSATPSGPQAGSFVLQVTQEPVAPPASPAPTSPTATDGSSFATVSVPQSGNASSSPTSAPAPGRSAAVLPTVESNPVSLKAPLPVASFAPTGLSLPPTGVAIGPLPERAGAPLGGVLTEGDPVPQLDRHDPALVDLALIGLPVPLPGAEGAGLDEVLADLDSELALAPEAAEPLVAIRGPGGFPLLTASLRADPAPDFDALIALLPPSAAMTARVEPAPAPASIPVPADAATEPRSRAVPRLSALSGLSVAMAMVFGLMLPDLTSLLTIVEAPRFRLRFGPLLRRRHVA